VSGVHCTCCDEWRSKCFEFEKELSHAGLQIAKVTKEKAALDKEKAGLKMELLAQELRTGLDGGTIQRLEDRIDGWRKRHKKLKAVHKNTAATVEAFRAELKRTEARTQKLLMGIFIGGKTAVNRAHEVMAKMRKENPVA
jgi:hypothetical protein